MILMFFACDALTGPDLPDGWADATAIDDFSQTECGDTGAVALTATAEGEGVRLDAGPVGARCQQELEGWFLDDGSGMGSVLVQPVDMNPDMVPKCACSYDLSMLVPTAVPTTLELWQRSDRYGGDEPSMTQLGTVSAE